MSITPSLAISIGIGIPPSSEIAIYVDIKVIPGTKIFLSLIFPKAFKAIFKASCRELTPTQNLELNFENCFQIYLHFYLIYIDEKIIVFNF